MLSKKILKSIENLELLNTIEKILILIEPSIEKVLIEPRRRCLAVEVESQSICVCKCKSFQ